MVVSQLDTFTFPSLVIPERKGLMVKKETNLEAANTIPPLAYVRLFERRRFVPVATKKDVDSSHPLFAKDKSDPFNLTAYLRLFLSRGHLYELLSSCL